MEMCSGNFHHTMDDTYFSALIEDDSNEDEDTFPADHKYAESLQLQEALMGGVLLSLVDNRPSGETLRRTLAPEVSPMNMVMDQNVFVVSDCEIGESSLRFCEICAERKETDSMFTNSSCKHTYCSDCVTKYVMGKLLESVAIVTCPDFDCEAVLSLETCRSLLPKDATELWEELLSRDSIDASQMIYCPYKDCSAMMIKDDFSGLETGAIAEAECPLCHRLFCARCNVRWHADLTCEDYQKLDDDEKSVDDIAVVLLARVKKWGRCPNCKFYVERTEGCPHMRCRCGFEFCYGCGLVWNVNHGGCSTR